jgi:3D (Asp-Asp-Asp) domain-containing protein
MQFMNNFKENLKLAKNKLAERLLLVVALVVLANLIFTPYPTLAYSDNLADKNDSGSFDYQLVTPDDVDAFIKILNPEVLNIPNIRIEDGRLPKSKALEAKYELRTVITAYNSEVGQCDATPCITANGFNVCKHAKEDTVAINGLKMGTKVRFPELFGDKVFVVRDRMNSRYGIGRADVWMISKADAKSFGVKLARMEVLE